MLKKSMIFKIDEELYDQLKELAFKKRSSMAYIIREALIDRLQLEEEEGDSQ